MRKRLGCALTANKHAQKQKPIKHDPMKPTVEIQNIERPRRCMCALTLELSGGGAVRLERDVRCDAWHQRKQEIAQDQQG